MSGGKRPETGGERKCPICGKPASEEHKPFCSKRCAQIDLNRWLSGAYVIPGPPQSEADRQDEDDQEG